MTDNQLGAEITGFGWVTAAGCSRGQNGEIPIWEAGEPLPPALALQGLNGGSRFGRLDLFSQIGVAAIALALKDADRLYSSNPTNNNCQDLSLALICATTSSCNRTEYDFFKTVQANPRLASPGLFVYTLATSFLGEAALRFAINGTCLALIEPQPSGAHACELASNS